MLVRLNNTDPAVADAVDKIAAHHRKRRYAMRLQQKIDRALESYVRINMTEWHPTDDEATRKKENAKALDIIKSARKGSGDADVVQVVSETDAARKSADAMRARAERDMEELASNLPIAPWCDDVHGFGILGLATILAEAGPLDNYANPQKLWKRLGFAPFDGHAGSTWKRESWRPRKLTAEEWIGNPFAGHRYALIHTIALWLKNHQWIGAQKTGTGEGKPNGHYGEAYAARRKRTAVTHPDWSKQHAHMDALRVMMKAFLLELWCVWNNKPIKTGQFAIDAHLILAGRAAAQQSVDAKKNAGRRTHSRKRRDQPGAVAQKKCVSAADAANGQVVPTIVLRRRHPPQTKGA